MDLIHLVLWNGIIIFTVGNWNFNFEQFREYLYYASSFRVYTDNNPLTYVFTSAKLNATGLCWIVDFDFDIRCCPGKTHVNADAFSRIPSDFETNTKSCTEDLSPDVIQAATHFAQEQDEGSSN